MHTHLEQDILLLSNKTQAQPYQIFSHSIQIRLWQLTSTPETHLRSATNLKRDKYIYIYFFSDSSRHGGERNDCSYGGSCRLPS